MDFNLCCVYVCIPGPLSENTSTDLHKLYNDTYNATVGMQANRKIGSNNLCVWVWACDCMCVPVPGFRVLGILTRVERDTSSIF